MKRRSYLVIRFLLLMLLAAQLTACFSPPAQIIKLDPDRGSTGVVADAPIKVLFDRPVQRETVASRFSISPGIGCDTASAFVAAANARCFVEWLGGQQPGFIFYHPQAPFAAATLYTVDLAAGFIDEAGTVNSLDHRWNITTLPAPVVVAFSPPDGASVPRDTPIAVNFSRDMDAVTTAAAISLVPAVPGTKIVRNSRDFGRFLVLPGRLLDPGVAYALRIGAAATDLHHSPLARAAEVHFTATATISPAEHIVVLEGGRGSDATSILLAQSTPLEAGEPTPYDTLVTAPVCTNSAGCGAAPFGTPLETYGDARLAAGGRWLAIQATDETQTGYVTKVEVVDLTSGSMVAMFPGAEWPRWKARSPDLMTAVRADGSAFVFDPSRNQQTTAPPGPPVTGPPIWLSDQTTLWLSVSRAGISAIDVVIASLQIRYQLPQPSGPLSHPVASPAGGGAVLESRSGKDRVWFLSPTGRLASLGSGLTPISFLGGSDLLCADSYGAVLKVDVGSGDRRTLTTAVPDAATPSLTGAPDGRQLAYIWHGLPYVANADGTDQQPLIPLEGDQHVTAVSFQA